MVDSLEDFDVQVLCLRRIKRHAKSHEGISKTLDSQTYRTMAHVRTTSFWDRVVIDVDDTVQVVGDHFGDIVQFLEIVLSIDNVGREGDRGKVADSRLIGGRVLNDFSTKIRRLDCPEILLIRLVCEPVRN